MLAYHELLYLKATYDDNELLYVAFEDHEFVFKCITREEYKEIISIIVDDFEFEDAVCQCCLVYPNEYDFVKSYLPGLSNKVAPIIVEISNLSNIKGLIEMYENEKRILNNFDEQCVTLIKAAFPEFSYLDINSWSWKKIMKYSARAEAIMKLRGNNVQMINNYEEFEQNVEEQTQDLTDYDIGNALRKQGFDPMEYFSYEFDKYEDKIDYPIIGSLNWKDESILESIRKQMEKNHGKRKVKKFEFTE